VRRQGSTRGRATGSERLGFAIQSARLHDEMQEADASMAEGFVAGEHRD
jgi:hypothetical protein